MRAMRRLSCLLLTFFWSNLVNAQSGGAGEAAALLHSKFTAPIVLHIGSDGVSQAQKLAAMNGVNNKPTYGATYEARQFLPCGGRREYTGLPSVQAHIDGYNLDPVAIAGWLSNNRIIQVQTYNIRYPNASMAQSYGGEDAYPCPIVNENVSKYLPPNQAGNLHNGLDIAIGRRVLTKWTFRNRYETPLPGKGNVKVFAGTFTYRIQPIIPMVAFPGEGTAKIKLILDPDDGRWTVIDWEKHDPSITLTSKPLEPSKAIASAMETEAKSQLAREKAAHEQQLENARALQRIVERLSGQWIGEWQVTGLQNPIATNKGNFSLDLQNNSSVLSGSYGEKGASSRINGRVDGNQISFEFRYSDGSSRNHVGTVDLQGVVSGQWTQQNFTGTWRMTQSRSVTTEQLSQNPPSTSLVPPLPPEIVANQGVPSGQSSQIPLPAFIPRPPETFACVRADKPSVTATLAVDFTNSMVKSLDGFGGIRAGVSAQITDATISWRNRVIKNWGGGGWFYYSGSIDRATRVLTFNVRGANNDTFTFECR